MFKRPAFVNQFRQSVFNKLLKNKHKTNEIELQHKTIYVLPSKLGGQFLLIALLNFVMGINYQNNLILAMAYLMVVVLVFAILTGYKNVRGLSVKYQSVNESYAPKAPFARFQIHARSYCELIKLVNDNLESETVSLQNNEKKTVEIALKCSERGAYGFDRIKIISHFPFGLVSVWSYIEPTETVYVYPQPITAEKLDTQLHDNDEHDGDNAQVKAGNDNFYQLTPFVQGTALNKVSWKHFAKTQQLLTKEFTSDASQELALNFNMLSGNNEHRLSQLCFLVNQLTDQHMAFSLTLPNKHIAKGQGINHQTTCLQALAES